MAKHFLMQINGIIHRKLFHDNSQRNSPHFHSLTRGNMQIIRYKQYR